MIKITLPILIHRRQWVIPFIVGAIYLLACAPTAVRAETHILKRETRTKSFDEVVFDLEFAITQRNFRITARNDIGRGIRERGVKDFPQAMIIHFCNLTFAHEALERDPDLITYMPCRVAVLERGDRIMISTTSLPEDSANPRVNSFSRRINHILRDILSFAIE